MILEKEKTPYNLYIDESGDGARYMNKEGQVIKGRHKFFTLAGIIVNKDEQKSMEGKTKWVIDHYLNGKPLGKNFKLHYYDLRNKHPPYDKLSDEKIHQLTDDIFNIIKNSDCVLLSVTINLENHYKKYPKPADPQAYAMLLMRMIFQDFLVDEKEGKGKIIYERFNERLQRKTKEVMEWLCDRSPYWHDKKLNNIADNIKNGDPKRHPILQLADFFAYVTWIREKSNHEKGDKWELIKHKYYKLDGGWLNTGNIRVN